MTRAKQWAYAAFRKIENSTVAGALYQVCYVNDAMRIGRAGTALSDKFEKRKPETIAGYYDYRCTPEMIEEDLISCGCPA